MDYPKPKRYNVDNQCEQKGVLMKNAKRLMVVLYLPFIILAAFLVSCGGEDIDAALVYINITPSNASISNGSTQQFHATGTFTDGSTQDLTNTVTWLSDNILVAVMDNKGLATSKSSGSAVITATDPVRGITSTSGGNDATLNVTAESLVSIAVTPSNASITNGLTQQFTAMGTYSDASTKDITNTVIWDSDDSLVATINSTGLASSTGEGVAIINATLSGVSSTDTAGDATLTVSSAALVSIAITPSAAIVNSGLKMKFRQEEIYRNGFADIEYHSAWYNAVGTYTDGSVHDISSSVTWISSDTSVAEVKAGGLVASKGVVGTSTISVLDPVSAISSSDSDQSASFDVTASTGEWRLTKIEYDLDNNSIINSSHSYTYLENANGITLTDFFDLDNDGVSESYDQFIYNSSGKELRKMYDGGASGIIEFIYNSSGRLETGTADWEGDGNLDEMGHYYYDASGFLIMWDTDLWLDGNIEGRYYYTNDARGNVLALEVEFWGTISRAWYMTYDVHNNKISMIRDDPVEVLPAEDWVYTYTYINDKLTRLDVDIRNDGLDYYYLYAYDSNGNLSTRTTLSGGGSTVLNVAYYTWNFQ